MPVKQVALVLALLALLAGCGGTIPTKFSFQQVNYSLTGGIGGYDRQLVITADGAYRLLNKGAQVRSGNLTGAELQGLKERLGKVEWPTLQHDYLDPSVADALYETVTLKTDIKEYLVMTGTGGPVPEGLAQVTTYLKHLQDSYLR